VTDLPNGVMRTPWPRNPFAIAELVLDQRIDWRLERIGSTLIDVLRLKPDDLMNEGSGAPTLLSIFLDAEWQRKGFEDVSHVIETLISTAPGLWDTFRDQQAMCERVLPYLVPVRNAAIPPGAKPGDAMRLPSGLARSADRFIDDDGASYLDPVQGAVNDCGLIAAMIAVAWSRTPRWDQRVATLPSGQTPQPWFGWKFFPGERLVQVPRDLPVLGDGTPAYARSNDRGECWPGIIEKGFAMTRQPVAINLSLAQYPDALNNTVFPEGACVAIFGGVARPIQKVSMSGNATLSALSALCGGGDPANQPVRQPVMATTWTKEQQSGVLFSRKEISGVFPHHAYAVLGIAHRPEAAYVVLRNPHSKPVDPAPAAGINYLIEDEWVVQFGAQTRKVPLNDAGGVFALPEREFVHYFENFCTVDSTT